MSHLLVRAPTPVDPPRAASRPIVHRPAGATTIAPAARLIAALVIVLGAAACGAPVGSPAGGPPAAGAGFGAHATFDTTVTRDIDGDTIVVAWPSGDAPDAADAATGPEEKVRLIGIDTPETKKPNTPVECYGKAASAHTATLLPPGTAVHLVRDAEERDKYGRILAYVYRAADGVFINEDLAIGGFASPLTIPPNVAHEADIARAVDEARHAQRGLWGACAGPHVAASGGP